MIFSWSILSCLCLLNSNPFSSFISHLMPLLLELNQVSVHFRELGVLLLLWKAPSYPTYWLISTYPLGRTPLELSSDLVSLRLIPQKGSQWPLSSCAPSSEKSVSREDMTAHRLLSRSFIPCRPMPLTVNDQMVPSPFPGSWISFMCLSLSDWLQTMRGREVAVEYRQTWARVLRCLFTGT